jgi:hypothetical protein
MPRFCKENHLEGMRIAKIQQVFQLAVEGSNVEKAEVQGSAAASGWSMPLLTRKMAEEASARRSG